MSVAPPAPRAADRRPGLISLRALALAAAVLLAAACSGSDDQTQATVDDTVAPTLEPVDGDDAAGDDDAVGDEAVAAPDADDDESKEAPARDAGVVDAPADVQPEGFTTVTVRVTSTAGEVCEVCLWHADTGDERNRGLMGVTDLGEPVGMLFEFQEPTSGNFFMFGTPMPLSIAWFTESGDHVGQTDMSPCLVEASGDCERFGPGADYVYAIEMVQGELDVIGIGSGATIEVLAEHDTCPVAP